MIEHVLLTYYPGWDPPPDNGNEWISCLCPAHDDNHPSASVSYTHNAFACFTCGYRGDIYSIIMKEEQCDFHQALTIAEGIAHTSGQPLPPASQKQPPGTLPGRPGPRPRRHHPVSTRLRSRPFT